MTQIITTVPETHRAAASALYWQAFGGKLGAVMGPAPRALAYFDRVLRLDHCIGALQEGRLVGIVGLQSPSGNFAGGSWADLRAVYGAWGAAWRFGVLAWVSGPEAEPQSMMIDGFSVQLQARGQGIGAALLAAALRQGRSHGYRAAQLDVTGSNWRARAFYARHGFSIQHRRSIWPLGAAFGFGSVTRMSIELD